ncbi:MAG TPA: hypothetical protein PLD59_12885, partial [Tepidisphaeraceae bacterium]|nr:hypothetical protein [Tepidisphaeraceae bacterium]
NAGTYFIRVQGSGAYGDLGGYRLNVRVGLASTTYNDTIISATQLGLFGATDNASVVFGYAGTAIISDSLASNDTIDYFRFRAPNNTRQVYAQLSGQTVSASLSLYQDINGNGIIETGEIVGAFNPGTTTQTINHTTAVGNRNYYARILRSSSATTSGNYTLRITTDVAPSALPSSLAPATFDPQPLLGAKDVYDSIDSTAGDTVDYYRARASANGLMAFYLSNFGNGDPRLDVGNDLNGNGVFDTGEIIATSANIGNGSSEFVENIAVTQGQTLLVRITAQTAGTSTNYQLQAVADYATGGNTTGAITGARDFSNKAAARIREHLGYSVDLFDTIRINPTVGPIVARLTPFGSTAFHRLDIIRDANNNGLLEQGEIIAQTTSSNVNLTANAVAGGTYYIRVRTQLLGEFGSFGNYDLEYTTAGAVTGFNTGAPGAIALSPSPSSSGGYLGFDPSAVLAVNNTEDFYQFTLAARARVDFGIAGAGMGLQIGTLDAQRNFQKLAGVGTFDDISTALNVNLNAGTYVLRAFLPVGERQDEAEGGNYTITYNTAAITDNSAPTVTSAAGQYEIAPVGASFTFDQNVQGSIDDTDVTIRNLADNSITAIDGVFYDPVTRRAGFGAASRTLPDGNYRATLAAGSVYDASGNPNAAAADADFFILAGDANRDRKVNLDDFTIVAANFGTAGKVFSQGNFDYSDEGTVELTDFTILASNFGKILATPSDLPRGGSGSTATIFGSRTIDPIKQVDDEAALVLLVV